MNILDEYGNSLTFTDSDTVFNNEGKRFRVRGFDGLETDKLVKDNKGNWIIERGEFGADFQTKKVAELLSAGNYYVKYSGEIDNSKGEREIIDFVNDKGENAATELYRQGITKINGFTSDGNISAQEDRRAAEDFFGETNIAADKIGREYRNTMASLPIQYKEMALNEKTFNPNIHSGVAFRDYSKTIDNKPLGFFNSAARSFGVGYDGVFEGLYGYADALGQISDIEMIENFGERNVVRIREEMSNAPELLLNYKDVESITDGFQYAMNTAGMAAPYMIAGFASLATAIPLSALAGPTAGLILSQVPQTMIYAGHTWNEMEGEKGLNQFVTANVSGVLQATLERFGLRGLMQPVDLLSKAGKARVIKHIANNNKVTPFQAEIILNAQLKGAIKDQVKFLGKDFARFSAASFGGAVAKGMTREGLTEIGQELTQTAAVTLGSDTVYTDEEIKERLMNAGIGGALLGGAYGGTGNVYKQGKNQLTKQMYFRADDSRSTPIEQKRLEDEKSGKLNDSNRRINTDIERQEASAKNQIDPLNPDSKPTTVVYDVNGQPHRVIDLGNNRIQEMKDPTKVTGADIHTLGSLDSKFFTQSAFDPRFKLIDGTSLNNLGLEQANNLKATLLNQRANSANPILLENNLKAVEYKIARDSDPTQYQGIPTLPAASKTYDKRSKDNLQITGNLAREHEAEKRGTYNFIKNSEGLKDFVVNLTSNTGKLFRAVENYMLSHKKLVTSDIALKIWSRIAGLTSSAYLSGRNFVEYARDIVSDLKSYVDENEIAMDLTGDTLTADSAVEISKELIMFGESGNFDAMRAILFATTLHQPNLLRNEIIAPISGYQLLQLHSEVSATGLPDGKKSEQKIVAEEKQRQQTIIEQHLQNKYGIKPEEIVTIRDFIERNGKIVKTLDSDSKPTGETTMLIDDKFKLLKKIELIEKTGEFEIVNKPIDSEAEFSRFEKLFIASSKLKASYDKSFELYSDQIRKEKGKATKEEEYDPNYWWKNQGFNWKEVKRNPIGFKKWLMSTKLVSKAEADRMYDTISREGLSTINDEFSMVDGRLYSSFAFNPKFKTLYSKKGYSKWASKNLFEALNKNQVEVSKFVSSAEYFGDGGWKLNQLFKQLKEETEAGMNDLTLDDVKQFAYYTKAVIDSAHGNFNRIASKDWAAINRYLTSWTIFSGLPLAAIASIPETAMVYFNLKDDQEFKRATDIMVKDLSSIFSKALKDDVKNTEKLLKQIGLTTDQNTVVDRYATGERDIAFMRAHEAFFKGVGIQKITQFQRRLNAAIGLDFLKSNFSILRLAPRKYNAKDKTNFNFNFDMFTERERLAYNQLKELGIDVEFVDSIMNDLDEVLRDPLFDLSDGSHENRESPLDVLFDVTNKVNARVEKELVRDEIGRPTGDLKGISPREQLLRKVARNEFKADRSNYETGDVEVDKNTGKVTKNYGRLRINEAKLVDRVQNLAASLDDEIETGLYRFVNERVQLPGASNRPLFFQDPHYQLLTQFNGFLSTFTANIVPKLWNRNLRKGNTKVKYDTFALMILMIGLGGASQYLKDLIKFLQPSPYLDGPRYVQRAIYSSGVLGQYERVIDTVAPLYPDRDTGLDNVARQILGETGPAARNIQNLLTGLGQLAEGESERAVNSIAKTLPITGPIPIGRTGLSDVIHFKNPLDEDLNRYLFGN